MEMKLSERLNANPCESFESVDREKIIMSFAELVTSRIIYLKFYNVQRSRVYVVSDLYLSRF